MSEEDRMRADTAPMTVQDAGKRINLAWQDRDYFRLLQLPYPEADELGRAVWGCSSGDVAKAYRKISILVHPDKVSGEEARQAFEHLNQAYRLLKDAGKLEEILKEAAVKAQAERERREASASGAERIALNAQRNEKAKELRKQQGKNFQDEILLQMKRRQEEAKRKRQLKSTYRREDLDKEAGGGGGGSGSDGEAAEQEQQQQPAAAAKKRKKPMFL